jgi:hypothetical protein
MVELEVGSRRREELIFRPKSKEEDRSYISALHLPKREVMESQDRVTKVIKFSSTLSVISEETRGES